MTIKRLEPKSIGILTTYKCNAKCEDCCFECSPLNKETLSLTDIYRIIDNSMEFEDLKMIVWSGGEAFLLKDNLLKGIEYASSKGLKSRVISNGYWAVNIESAKKILKSLKKAGMMELNISTGDNHQKYVSIEKVLTAIYAAVSEGIQTAIMIEVTKDSKFTQKDLKKHYLYKKIENEGLGYLVEIANSPWVSLTNDTKYKYNEIEDLEIQNGCDNLFNYLAVDSFNDIYSCCGLTVRRIDQLKIGNLENDNLIEKYKLQANDFIKKWLYTSGPINIIHQVKEWNSSIEVPKFAHHCQFCDFIYNNETVLKTIHDNQKKIESHVDEMFSNKVEFSLLIGS